MKTSVSQSIFDLVFCPINWAFNFHSIFRDAGPKCPVDNVHLDEWQVIIITRSVMYQYIGGHCHYVGAQNKREKSLLGIGLYCFAKHEP